MQAQPEAVKVTTELTCWKCGGETLQEIADAIDPNAFRSAKVVASGILQSRCTKCGTHSVNATQARHNRALGRRTRKAIIKEANRKAS